MINSIFHTTHYKIRFIESEVIDVYTSKIILNFTLFIRVKKTHYLYISLKVALFLFTKKLQCFSEIPASPKDDSKGTDSLINSHTFLLV